MAAIWGCIDFTGKHLDYEVGLKMENAMKAYKIERFDTKTHENVTMGCGHQWITETSKNEVLPLFLGMGIYYTADCMIDNRDELMKKLNIVNKDTPDGQILYQSFMKWGISFTNHVLGIFAMAVYIEAENKCYLFTDHMGSRCLYYHRDKNRFYFATLIGPIVRVVDQKSIKPNEKWLAACLTTASPDMEVFEGLTAFSGINQLIAGHYVVFDLVTGQGKEVSYWNPTLHVKEEVIGSKEESKTAFIELFQACVLPLLRSTGNTGMMLSSGLDSTAVASIAALILEKEDKKLYSYTAIPLSDYENNNHQYYINDESEGVKIFVRRYKNIIPTFSDYKGKTAYTVMKRMVTLLEMPYKAVQNIPWLDDIYEKAANNNCKIILKGQYGNGTISYGAILTKVYQDFSKFRIRSGLHEINLFCSINRISRKKAVKFFVSELKKKIFQKKIGSGDTLLKREVMDRYDIASKMASIKRESGGTYMDSRRQRLQFLFYEQGLAQLGAYDTKLGLIHGVIIRDPSKDKRMIEFCAKAPISLFVHDGVERAFIRTYMQGFIPEQLLGIITRRGRQGADFTYRLQKDWPSIKDEVEGLLLNKRIYNYVEKRQVDELVTKLNDDEASDLVYAQCMILCSFSIFMNRFFEEEEEDDVSILSTIWPIN